MTAPLEDDKLQQYFDGELSDAEAETIRQDIEASEEIQFRLETLSRLHALIGVAAEELGDDIASDELWTKVRAGIAEQKEKGFGEGLRVVDGGGSGSGEQPVEGWKVWIPVAAGFAVAAAVLFAVLSPEDEGSTEPRATVEPSVEVDDTSMTVIEESEMQVFGSEVEEVDFGTNTGTVFQVEGQAGEPIAVVWINDDEATQ